MHCLKQQKPGKELCWQHPCLLDVYLEEESVNGHVLEWMALQLLIAQEGSTMNSNLSHSHAIQ